MSTRRHDTRRNPEELSDDEFRRYNRTPEKSKDASKNLGKSPSYDNAKDSSECRYEKGLCEKLQHYSSPSSPYRFHDPNLSFPLKN